MKTWITVLVSALLFSGSVLAADVAVLDLQKAIASTEAAKKRGAELQQDGDFRKLMAQVETLRSELNEMNKEAEKNRMTWSAEQANEFKSKMDFKVKDLQLAGTKLQQMEQMAMQSLVAQFKPLLSKAIDEVIKEEGIGLLLKSEAAHMAVPAFDITAKVTAKLNKQ